MQQGSEILQRAFSCFMDEEMYSALHLKVVLLGIIWSCTEQLKLKSFKHACFCDIAKSR